MKRNKGIKLKRKIFIKKSIIKNFIFISICMLFSISVVSGQEVENENKINTEEITNSVLESVTENVNMLEYIETLQEYVDKNNIEGIDVEVLKDLLLDSGTLDYKNIVIKIIGVFSKDLVNALSGAISIFIVIIIMSILSSLELEEKSDITKLSHLVCYLAVVVIMFTTFTNVISSFKDVITSLTTLMQFVAPFIMAVIMATGKITTIGVIKPMLLFLASAIGFLVNYIVVPFICISVSLNTISNLSENLNLGKLSKLFSNASIWIISVTLTIFLGILSLETTLTSSVDTLAIKATQTAVSNFVPVVGKFFSDSFETVVGATKIIANVSGILGIVVVFLVSIVPILKIFSIMVIYMLLASLAEPICQDENITKFISSFTSIYKTLLGILIGISILFIISIGIILNLASSIAT